MNPVALMAMQLGLVSPEMRAQFSRWGDVPEVSPIKVGSPEEVAELVELAMQSHDLVPKVTDLELLQQFAATQRIGNLHLETGDQKVDIDVVFGVHRTGDVILPWRSEDIREYMLNPETVLTWNDGGEHQIRFAAVEDAYYGDQKAFMLCTPEKQVGYGNAS